ncbi:MAG: hypothetical protein ISS61_04460 [Desulfobacteraceae bacterium]|nr:hypothetical protein [Desulfobacteraceae bacterium]
MKKSSNFDIEAKSALISCLEKVPFLAVEEIVSEFGSDGIRPDILVKVSCQEKEQVLVVEFRKNGQPRMARDAVNQLQRYLNKVPGAYGVLVAPYISQAAAEICKQDEVGYLDLSGNCRICFDSIYVEQQGRPNLFAKKRDLRSLYSPKAERVLRVLLNNPNKTWKTVELADEARVSLGQISNVKKLLLDREWVDVKKQGFLLIEPEQLLEGWKENYSFRRNKTRDLYSIKSTAETESDISEFCRRKKLTFAFTGFSGAARFAPSVRYNRAMAYVEETIEDMLTDLSLKEVSSGANVSLFTPYDDGVYYGSRDVNGSRVVSPVQAYLDVTGFRGRGEEAAQALLDQVIRPSW